MTTITASTTIGVNLDLPAYTSPVAIAPGVTISNPTFPYAVYAASGGYPPVTLQNYGTITASGRAGVYLAPGGVVTNAAAGFIAGRNAAIEIATHSGTVVNYGRIVGSRLTGISLPSGGTIINDLHGRIFGNNLGVAVGTIGSTIAGTVINAGVIQGGSYRINGGGAAVAVYESSFTGATGGIVVNSGTITDPIGSGVILGGGGTVTNMAHALIGNGVNVTGGRYTAATLVNDGSISGGVFVGFDPGGSVTNGVQGTIEGSYGVAFPGTLVNEGRIYGITRVVYAATVVGTGVLLGGGSVTNAAGAVIAGGTMGVRVEFSAGTIVNSGTIAGTLASGYGIDLGDGGTVTNAASGTISGGRAGIVLRRGGTVINAGTIVGTHAVAVSFRGGIGTNNLLVLEPGYGFSGNVIGGAANTHDAIELASAASAGTVAGLGSKFANFTSINFDPGAVWSISGIQRGLAGPIGGFAAGDTIELLGVTASNPGFADDILTLNAATASTLELPGGFTIDSFDITSNSDGTEVTLACFCAGTRLLTNLGEVAVEALTPGDVMVTRSGRMRRVKWIGHRRLEPARHAQPWRVRPVRIFENAFAIGVPHRDLLLSPDHAVAWERSLIPVRYLCNGATIRQEATSAVDYYHVELDTHDILLAEGLAAESFLDTGNRCAFANGELIQVHPDFSTWAWEALSCAPLLVSGPVVVAAQRHLMGRAMALVEHARFYGGIVVTG